jgi:Aspartyl/Asparaginyl beta-hydroxylase
MLLDKDIIELGSISEEELKTAIDALERIDWLNSKYDRHKWDPSLLEGRQLMFPCLLSPPNQRQYEGDEKYLSDVFMDISSNIRDRIFPDWKIIRAEVAGLGSDKKVLPHKDIRWFHEHSKRIHVPIVTNDECFNIFEDREYHFVEANIYEINNRIVHYARNSGKSLRIHLIMDVISPELYKEGIEDDKFFIITQEP